MISWTTLNILSYNGSPWKSVPYTFIFHIIPNHFNLHASNPTQTFPRQMRRCLHQTLRVKTAYFMLLLRHWRRQERTRTCVHFFVDHWNPHNNALKLIRLKGWISATILSSVWQFTTSQRVKPGWDFSQPCRFHGCEFGCFLRQRRPSVQRQWVLLKPTTRKQWGYANPSGSKSRMFFGINMWINYRTSG